jgi:hypothetical protein
LLAAFNPPVRRPLDAAPVELLPGRLDWQCQFGLCRLVLDTTEFEFFIEASPEYMPEGMIQLLQAVHSLGFEIDEEDYALGENVELLDNDWTRIYLGPDPPC